jgi:hypothetical protein
MPSSTSSSERRWGLLLGAAVLLAAAAVGGAERYWRGAGYAPQVIDSKTLWALERSRVDRARREPFVILGASRILCGADLPTLRERLPGHQPVMLAINALYPLAVLRDLAADEDFRGTVLLDVDTRGLTRPMWDLQQPWVDHASREFSPSLALNRILLNHWQERAVVAQHDLSLPNTLRRWLAGAGEPFRPYSVFHADRSCDIDYSRTDPALARAQFDTHVAANRAKLDPGIAPDRFLADLVEVDAWIDSIQRRGGTVIVYQTPTSGARLALEEEIFPRDRYWDPWAARTSARVLHFADEPALSAFHLPDDSHLDFRDKPAYTLALVEVLVRRGWIEP